MCLACWSVKSSGQNGSTLFEEVKPRTLLWFYRFEDNLLCEAVTESTVSHQKKLFYLVPLHTLRMNYTRTSLSSVQSILLLH